MNSRDERLSRLLRIESSLLARLKEAVFSLFGFAMKEAGNYSEKYRRKLEEASLYPTVCAIVSLEIPQDGVANAEDRSFVFPRRQKQARLTSVGLEIIGLAAVQVRFRQHRKGMCGGSSGRSGGSWWETQAEQSRGRRGGDRYTGARTQSGKSGYARMRSHRRTRRQLLGVHLLYESRQVRPLLLQPEGKKAARSIILFAQRARPPIAIDGDRLSPRPTRLYHRSRSPESGFVRIARSHVHVAGGDARRTTRDLDKFGD